MDRLPISEVYLMDCMEYMRGIPDKFFELAVVDPPYGIGEDGGKSSSRRTKSKSWGSPKPSTYKSGGWDKEPMNVDFFNELKRVSINQIIWGANHFISKIPYDSPSWVVWDKKDGKDFSDFADCELAWTSFKGSVRMFRLHWTGWGAINQKESRIHPTQKPIALYEWLLKNYAKPGDKILDTHMGSQSSRIAAYKIGFDFYGTEIDQDYFSEGCARFEKSIAMPLFDILPLPEQAKLFSE
jgi:site-specific DNA-methyltransferase (adenine-specific)